jgi:hypothetical protein
MFAKRVSHLSVFPLASTFAAAQGATVVHSSKSGASLWDLAGFDQQFELARSNAAAALTKLNQADAPARRRPARAAR